MKLGIIVILCILLSLNYVSAKDVILGAGESYERGGVRITLARIDRNYDKVVLCVNNEKQIVNENQFAYFKSASLEVEHIDKKYNNIEINVHWMARCIDCKCEGDCLNDKCKIEMYDEFGNPTELIEEKDVLVKDTNTDLVIENEKPNYLLTTTIFIIGILAGLMLVWLLWFRKMSF